MEGKKGISEDWLSLWLGLFIFLLGLGVFVGIDLLGWGIKTNVWLDITKALSPVSGTYKGMPGFVSLLLTYVFMLVIMRDRRHRPGGQSRQVYPGIHPGLLDRLRLLALGHFGYIAATDAAKAGIGWSLKLTGEAGFIVALIVGLIVGNFFPKFSGTLKEATRPELYIKTAIVIMGAGLGVKAAEAAGLASAVLFRGLCAIVEAYLIYWAVVYFVARKYFKFSREWAAPLASGISICGVSAAIATGGAIRARPVVPIMVSSLVVIFAVVELIFLPFVAQFFLWTEPMVAGAWMALAVKTDGAAVASGAIVDSLIRAKALAEAGINYKEGWMLMTATTVKVFIDVFIGVWAFILAVIWCTKIECTGGRIKAVEIWERFPKFVIGYVVTFLIMLFACLNSPAILKTAKAATGEMDVFRGMFFVLTFFTIGVVSNFKKLWEEGIGKLAAVYVLCLFGFIIWVGLLISWIFFHGVKPPLAG